jgi:hypothetical protein
MQNVPKIVTERLRAMAVTVDGPVGHPLEHPDADLLTAFAERSLPQRERGTVLDHLSRCRDCRDIVALALPATEAMETVPKPVRSGWLTWPTLRWGFAVAGIIAVASFGIHEYQLRTATVAKEMVKTELRSQAVADSVATAAPPSAAPAAASAAVSHAVKAHDKKLSEPNTSTGLQPSIPAAGKTQHTEPTLMARAVPALPLPSFGSQFRGGMAHGGVGHGATGHGATAGRSSLGGPVPPMQQLQAQQQGLDQAKQQNTDISGLSQVPSASETVEVTGAAPQIESKGAATVTEAANYNASLPGQPPQMFEEDAQSGVNKAKPAMNGRNFTQLITITPGVALWSINSAGGLQRSFDQGSTWQDVNVIANVAPPSAGTNRSRAADTAGYANAAPTAQMSAKKVAAPASIPVFRAVTATGSDIWAGGSGSALYHSLDGGNHWTRVVPSAAGVSLTGDIVQLQFSDAQHGKVITSSTEVWMTGDDGQAWQKQ